MKPRPLQPLVQRAGGFTGRRLQGAQRRARAGNRHIEFADSAGQAFLALAHRGQTPLQHDAIEERGGKKRRQDQFDDEREGHVSLR